MFVDDMIIYAGKPKTSTTTITNLPELTNPVKLQKRKLMAFFVFTFKCRSDSDLRTLLSCICTHWLRAFVEASPQTSSLVKP